MMAEMERFDEAEVECRRALSLADQVFGPESVNSFEILGELIDLQAELGDPEVGEPFVRRRVELATLLFGPDDERVADALHEHASVLGLIGRYDEAELAARRYLEVAEEIVGADDLAIATGLATLGTLLAESGRPDEAEAPLRRALDIAAAQDAQTEPEALDIWVALSLVLEDTGRAEESAATMRRLLDLLADDPEAEPYDEARVLNRLASALRLLERFGEAADVMRRAIALLEADDENDPGLTVFYENLANLLDEMGEFEASDDAWVRALALAEQTFGPDELAYGDALANYATALFDRGESPRAEPFVRRAIRVFETAGLDPEALAANLNRLAGILGDQGRFDEAEEQYRRALDLLEQQGVTDDPRVAIALTNLGQLLFDKGDLDRAEDALRASIEMGERVFADDPAMLVQPFTRLGDVLGELEDDRAEAAYKRAINCAEQTGDLYTPDAAAALRGLGALYIVFERPEDAQEPLEQALDIQRTVFGDANPEVSLTASLAAVALRAQFRYDDALEYARLAVTSLEEMGDAPAERLADELGFLGTTLHALERYDEAEEVLSRAEEAAISALTEDDEAVLWIRDRRGAALVEMEHYEDAEAIFERQLELLGEKSEPWEPRAGALAGLAKSALKQERFSDAYEYASAAVSVHSDATSPDDPELAYGYRRIAKALDGMERHEEAADAAMRGLELAEDLDPRDPDAPALRDDLRQLLG